MEVNQRFRVRDVVPTCVRGGGMARRVLIHPAVVRLFTSARRVSGTRESALSGRKT